MYDTIKTTIVLMKRHKTQSTEAGHGKTTERDTGIYMITDSRL